MGKGIDMLLILNRHPDGITLAALADAVGMSERNTRRYLQQFERIGAVGYTLEKHGRKLWRRTR
jgi:DNA-binding IclR family transcriptional regulator